MVRQPVVGHDALVVDSHQRLRVVPCFDEPRDGIWASDHFAVVADLGLDLKKDAVADRRPRPPNICCSAAEGGPP